MNARKLDVPLTESVQEPLGRVLRGVRRDIASLVKVAHAQGLAVEKMRHHIRVANADGLYTILSVTPSDARSVANSKARLRSLGVDFGDRKKKAKKT